MPVVKVQEEDFSIDAEVKALLGACENAGAVVTFSGIVRGHDHQKDLSEMTLEHYPGMTEKALSEIADEAMARWNLETCLILHRHGRLKPGENIVLAVAISQHRGDAFEAASYLMDFLKTRAPFWKKEKTGGEENWVQSRICDEQKTKNWED